MTPTNAALNVWTGKRAAEFCYTKVVNLQDSSKRKFHLANQHLKVFMSQSINLPTEHIEVWKARLANYRSVCSLMRDLAKEYGAQRHDVGFMLYSLFDNFTLDELSYVWKWDFENKGIGVSDERIDKLLAHLLLPSHLGG